MEISTNLELVRLELGLSNRDFASLLGVHETYYSKLKAGSVNPGFKTLKKIQEGLPYINIDWLLKNEGDRVRSFASGDPLPENIYFTDKNNIEKEIMQRDFIIKLQQEMIEMLKKRVEELERGSNGDFNRSAKTGS